MAETLLFRAALMESRTRLHWTQRPASGNGREVL